LVKISYIISIAVLLALTMASMSSHIISGIFGFIGIPKGYMSLSLLVLALPFFVIIVLTRTKQIVASFWSVAKYWVPWIAYICISGMSSPEGMWKLKMYLGITVLPSMLLVITALANPLLFYHYFMKILLFINIAIVLIIGNSVIQVHWFHGAEGIQRMIWLSRGIGINIAYFVTTSEWKKKPFIVVPLIAILFYIMLYIGSRGPVISLILTLGMFWLISNKKNLAIAILSCVVFAIFVISIANIDYLSDYVRSFSTHGQKQAISRFGQDRLSAYSPTLEIFADHPLVGVGLGQWWPAYQKKFSVPEWQKYKIIEKRIRDQLDVQYPHNIFLEILSELGILGMCLFLLLFLPFRRLFSVTNEYNLLCLLGFLYAFTSSDITQNSAPMIFNLLSILRARGLLPVPDENTCFARKTNSGANNCHITKAGQMSMGGKSN
jgi:O-antigen ligase